MKNTKLLFTYFIVNLFSALLYGQDNLVLNPSFEDVHLDLLSCEHYPDNESFNLAIEAWSSPSPASPDIFHLNLDEGCDLYPLNPANIANILPRTGNSMSGLAAYLDDIDFSYREYVQGKLREPLVIGHSYHVQFYVILGGKSNYATNKLGIKFFKDPYFQEDYTQIDVTPDYYTEAVLSDKETWTLIEFEFTPQTPDLTYFVIGHFFDYADTTIERLPSIPHKERIAYYLLDDVSITRTKPTFDTMGTFCKDAVFSLPEISKEGYTGTWSPEINNQETTTYTFTPDDPAYDTTTRTIEIIEPFITPTFDLVTSLCQGTVFELPPISTNGYKGTWSPEINNQTTTTYTFTPDKGQCVIETSLTIEIVKPTTPLFTLPSYLCAGTPFSLPALSDNGIRGSWSPAFNDRRTTTYTFQPVANEYCVVPYTTTIQIKHPEPIALFYYCYKGEPFIEVSSPSQVSLAVLTWKINDVVVEETSPALNLTNYWSLFYPSTNQIEVTTSDPEGCLQTESIELDNIEHLCFIPKGISPNGDRLNDFFDLSGFGGVNLEIFNRYGTKVYDKTNYTNQWQGQSNAGTSLPSGTYFYQIVTQKGEHITGWVQVSR